MDAHRGRPHALTGVDVGMVGTYPPTRCGIATFTASLTAAMSSRRCRVHVASSVEAANSTLHPSEVVAELVQGSAASREAVAESLSGCGVVFVQHEFGIYGGLDGSEVVDLVDRLGCPAVVVLHTVLRSPTSGQRDVLETLSDRAAAIVVQSAAARDRLLEAHDIDPDLVHLIPHGASPNLSDSPALSGAGGSPLVLTWGLIGPSKGIEVGIEAMALLGDLEPKPRYLVLGQTHPKVLQAKGEDYRASLLTLARELGVEDRVELDPIYNRKDEVLARVRGADIVLLPYRSHEQVVSGVLVEAIASSTPVVATGFPHARELLRSGAGVIVPHDDPVATAAAIRDICTDPERAARMIAAGRRAAPALFWDSVGEAYRQLAAAIAAPKEIAV
jgi:polysaccharide biosynthesis protein PslF